MTHCSRIGDVRERVLKGQLYGNPDSSRSPINTPDTESATSARSTRMEFPRPTHNDKDDAQDSREDKGRDEAHGDRGEEEDGRDDPDWLEHFLQLRLEPAAC